VLGYGRSINSNQEKQEKQNEWFAC
jgi:hypothetical protein